MAFTLNGEKFVYDYSDLISEIREDIDDHMLTTDNIIYIVRGDERKLTEHDSYKPIIDYYYLGDEKWVYEPLETIYNRDEFTDKEWEQLLDDQKARIRQYEEDKPHFEKATVMAVLTEMENWNRSPWEDDDV